MIRLTDDVLGSPLWRPLHDILIDWNEGRMKLEKQGLPDLVNKIAKGENNIKAIKQMVKVVSQAQLKKDAQWLQDNGVRFVKDEWEAIGHGGYYELEWSKFEQFLKEAGL